MIGKKITTTNITESKCEDLNDKQIEIFNDQISLVEDKICDKCKKDHWETLDLYLKGFYYDYIHEIDLENEVVIRFDLLLMMEEIECTKCYDHWDKYVDMEDERFRLDLKKMECYDQLSEINNNQKVWTKFTE